MQNTPRAGLETWGIIYLAGSDALTKTTLPTAYNLEDWQDGLISLGTIDNLDTAVSQLHTITPITPGDFTLDDTIDADDYSLWRSTYGPTGTSEADWDRNGIVDTADYVTWRDNLSTTSVSAPAANVPEPTTVAHGLFALACVLRCRRHRTDTKI